MKKSSTLKMGYLGILGLLLLTFFAFTLDKKNIHKPTVVNIDINFGRGPNCTSRGICSIDEPGSTGGFNQSSGQFYLSTNNQPVLTIFKNSISVATKEAQFINGTFEQIDDISIPDYFLDQIQSSKKYEIKNGTYTVEDLGDRYSISF